jgi:UDP-N-acetyl-2-amino-2-deoxyglucuronate dehydrogenase
MITKNIAIIGCGRIAGHHCQAICDIEGLNLIAVCDFDSDKTEIYAKQFGVASFKNYHKMLSAIPDIDIVVIATPSGMHFEHAMDIMERYQKDIVVEKPTFLKLSQVKAAYDVAKKHGVHIYPIFQNRFNKAVQRVKKALTYNELGSIRIITVRVRWCRPQRYYNLSEWRGTYAMDGGVLTNQGIHHVDLLRYLGGEVDEVQSVMRTLGVDVEVEDTVVATIKFASGAVGTLEVTTAARPDDFEASISMVGENGLAQIGGKSVNELEVFTLNESECVDHSENFTGSVYGNGHHHLYKSISDYFNKQIAYLISEEDCYNSIKLLHAFYASDEKNRAVKLTEQLESSRLNSVDENLAELYRTHKLDSMTV